MILVQNQVRNKLGGWIRLFTFGRISYKFGNTGLFAILVRYTWKGADFKVVVAVVVVVVVIVIVVVMTVNVARRDSAYP